MDLPLLVSPGKLDQLRDDLATAATRVGRIGADVDQLAIAAGWEGAAQRAFSATAQATGRRCLEASRRLSVEAARVDGLAEQLGTELAVLHRLEHDVLGALQRLATRASNDVTGEARSLYDSVRQRLPDRGSPGWRELAAGLVDGELR
jgi:hypothetical protein